MCLTKMIPCCPSTQDIRGVSGGLQSPEAERNRAPGSRGKSDGDGKILAELFLPGGPCKGGPGLAEKEK